MENKELEEKVRKLEKQNSEIAGGSMLDVIQYFRHKDSLTTEEDVLLNNLNEDAIKLQKGV